MIVGPADTDVRPGGSEIVAASVWAVAARSSSVLTSTHRRLAAPMSTQGPASPDLPDDGTVAATFCATLVDEWVRAGLTDAVICPGSRSTPMALAFARHQGVRTHVHIDERSGSFMALGLAKTSRRPVAMVCTSGTAAVEFHPAVVEADLAFVPLLVITADRPPELHGVGAPQTIDQRDLYGTSVRWYCEPGPPDRGGASWWRALARDSWSRTGGSRPGPVHLNLAFREPLLGTPAPLPPPDGPVPPEHAAPTAERDHGRDGAQWGLTDERLAQLVASLSGRRVLVVAGDRAAVDDSDRRALLGLARRYRWPVLADPLSGCRVADDVVIAEYDPILRDETVGAALGPEFVLRLGGLPSSKVLGAWSRSTDATQIGLDRYGGVPDPDRVLSYSGPADVVTVCEQLRAARLEPAPTDWLDSWRGAQRAARAAIDRVLNDHLEVTEPGVAVELASLMERGGTIVASSSMPVRDLEWFAPARDGLTIISNRGANGIDGVVSTGVGAALVGRPTAVLIGDVAFCHDSNGLTGVNARAVDLVIVVIDNDGGGIFSFLPQRSELDPAEFEKLFATPPGVDLATLASAHGLPVERVSTRSGLRAALSGALTRGGPRVVLVSTGRDTNVALHDEINTAVAAAVRTAVLSGRG